MAQLDDKIFLPCFPKMVKRKARNQVFSSFVVYVSILSSPLASIFVQKKELGLQKTIRSSLSFSGGEQFVRQRRRDEFKWTQITLSIVSCKLDSKRRLKTLDRNVDIFIINVECFRLSLERSEEGDRLLKL